MGGGVAVWADICSAMLGVDLTMDPLHQPWNAGIPYLHQTSRTSARTAPAMLWSCPQGWQPFRACLREKGQCSRHLCQLCTLPEPVRSVQRVSQSLRPSECTRHAEP